MGSSAKDAVSALIAVLRSDDHLENREAAAVALGQIGPAAKEAVAALKEAQLVPRFSVQYGGAYVEDLHKAAKEAQAKIEGNGTSVAPSSQHEVIATGQTDISGLAAPALRNGLLIDKSLSVAVAAYQRHVAGTQTGIFSTELTGLAITLAFRRVGSACSNPQLEIIITDDRGNEYRSLHRSPGSRVLYSGRVPSASELRGAPACLDQMPVGFTWTSELVVQMPPSAPVAKVELECALPSGSLFQRPATLRVPLNVANPVVPDFGFTIPVQLALAEGSTIVAGKDIRGKIGRLTVGDSFIIKTASGYGPPKTIRGLSLSLPVELTNLDYNQRVAVVPRLAIQCADGETLETLDEDIVQSAELKDNPNFLSGSPSFGMPGSSSHTVLLHVNIAAGMRAKVGSKLSGLLLYVQDTFCGFVRIPDDASAAIARIGGGDSSATTPAGSRGDGPPEGRARSTKIAETQPESDFLGEWTNRDFQTLGITRIRISRASRGSGRIVVRLWTKSSEPTGEWDHGDANAALGNKVLLVNQTSLGDVDKLEMTLLENGDMQVDAHSRFSGRESVDHTSGKSIFGKGLVHDRSSSAP
jgi:hypothetical protein